MFPKHMPQTEQNIVNKVITGALKEGWTIDVHDGVEWAVKRSTDRALIQRETCATDITSYRLRDERGRLVGTVDMVHGNHEDVLADWSMSLDRIIKPIIGL